MFSSSAASSDMVRKLVVKGCREGASKPLRVLDHLVQCFIALVDQRIVLLDLLVFGVNIELEALFFALKLHDLLIKLTDMHALIHRFLVDIVSSGPQLVHLTLQLVEVVVVGHFSVSCVRVSLLLLIRSKLLFQNL